MASEQGVEVHEVCKLSTGKMTGIVCTLYFPFPVNKIVGISMKSGELNIWNSETFQKLAMIDSQAYNSSKSTPATGSGWALSKWDEQSFFAARARHGVIHVLLKDGNPFYEIKRRFNFHQNTYVYRFLRIDQDRFVFTSTSTLHLVSYPEVEDDVEFPANKGFIRSWEVSTLQNTSDKLVKSKIFPLCFFVNDYKGCKVLLIDSTKDGILKEFNFTKVRNSSMKGIFVFAICSYVNDQKEEMLVASGKDGVVNIYNCGHDIHNVQNEIVHIIAPENPQGGYLTNSVTCIQNKYLLCADYDPGLLRIFDLKNDFAKILEAGKTHGSDDDVNNIKCMYEVSNFDDEKYRTKTRVLLGCERDRILVVEIRGIDLPRFGWEMARKDLMERVLYLREEYVEELSSFCVRFKFFSVNIPTSFLF